VTVASEALARLLPPGSVLIPNPPGWKRDRSPIIGRRPLGRRGPGGDFGTRALYATVLGPLDDTALADLCEQARACPGLVLDVLDGTGTMPDAGWPENVRVRTAGPADAGPPVGLAGHLAKADAVVMVSAGPESDTPDLVRSRLLEALAAGCRVFAAAPLQPVLAEAARTADLSRQDLSYFTSFADLVERLSRYSLTTAPAQPRTLAEKAERLRWAPTAEAFEGLLAALVRARATSARG